MTDQMQPGAVRPNRRNSMQATPNTQHSLALGYLGLRRMIGLIGILLPIVLIVGRMLFESPGIKDSISVYYYSVMRDVFVGSLWAIAVFLFSYRYDSWDDFLGDVACVAATGVAIFPTAPDKATGQQIAIGWAHGVFAACFLLALATFALWIFRKTDQKKGKLPPNSQHKNANGTIEIYDNRTRRKKLRVILPRN